MMKNRNDRVDQQKNISMEGHKLNDNSEEEALKSIALLMEQEGGTVIQGTKISGHKKISQEFLKFSPRTQRFFDQPHRFDKDRGLYFIDEDEITRFDLDSKNVMK